MNDIGALLEFFDNSDRAEDINITLPCVNNLVKEIDNCFLHLDKKIMFYSGRFASKFIEIDLADVSDVESEITFVHIKGGGYKVTVAGYQSFYNETPFDFKLRMADVLGKNYQKKDGKNMAFSSGRG